MNRTKCISLLVLNFILGSAVISGHAESARWSDLTPYQKELVTFALPEASEQVWDETATREFMEEYTVRSAIYHAVGMLMRNEGADRENAQRIIRVILGLQYNTPGEKFHGVWRTGLTSDRRDQNWREFIGVGLIIVREYFGDVIDPALIRDIDAALVLAAEGTMVRDVNPEYSNIALMSAFLMDYTGHIAGNPAFREKGLSKARAIVELFSRYESFTEFNSPTYYGVDLMALGLWRELGKSPELNEWGKMMESATWIDISQFYHAGLRNMCGPYVRSYGMDMTCYNALVGICIGLGLAGPEEAPLPTNRNRLFEWAYAPLFALLDVQPPKDLLVSFKTFDAPRQILKKVPHAGAVYQSQALLESDWMMGAATGMLRRHEQRCPGTVHWSAAPGDEVGWLLVYGGNGAEVRIENRSLHIFLPQPDGLESLRILVYTPDMVMEGIGNATWTLQGMKFGVETPLLEPTVEIKEYNIFGRVIEIAFPVPDGLSTEAPVLVLSPHKIQ